MRTLKRGLAALLLLSPFVQAENLQADTGMALATS
jgi:hypothetical protein